MIEIIPTVVPASLQDVERVVQANAHFARVVHIDAADGVFAPNTTWMPEGESFSQREGFTYEVHLMVADPLRAGLKCIEAGEKRVLGHIEAMPENAGEVLTAWKEAGALEVGLGILMDTPLSALEPFIGECDAVQMMSIAAGPPLAMVPAAVWETLVQLVPPS